MLPCLPQSSLCCCLVCYAIATRCTCGCEIGALRSKSARRTAWTQVGADSAGHRPAPHVLLQLMCPLADVSRPGFVFLQCTCAWLHLQYACLYHNPLCLLVLSAVRVGNPARFVTAASSAYHSSPPSPTTPTTTAQMPCIWPGGPPLLSVGKASVTALFGVLLHLHPRLQHVTTRPTPCLCCQRSQSVKCSRFPIIYPPLFSTILSTPPPTHPPDAVYLARWAATPVSKESIIDNLPKVNSKRARVAECLTRIAPVSVSVPDVDKTPGCLLPGVQWLGCWVRRAAMAVLNA